MKKLLTILSRVVPMVAVAIIYLATHPVGPVQACVDATPLQGSHCLSCACSQVLSGYTTCTAPKLCGSCVVPVEATCDH